MMFGAKSGGGFGGAVDYTLDWDGRNDKDARILSAKGVDVFFDSNGKLDADSRKLARSFRAQAMMNPSVKKCVKHLWVSYRPEDLLAMVNKAAKGKRHFNSLEEAIEAIGEQRVTGITNRAMIEDAKRLLLEMKYDNTQILIVRHSEKDNPHVHVIINLVDNNGKRLNDFQEKKRGIKICRQITIDNNYTWGDHKSVSTTLSNNPKDEVRYEICRKIFALTKTFHTAADLQREAALKNIAVRYSTNYREGVITGISFAQDNYRFPASRVDASLTASKLFPNQVRSSVSFSELPVKAQNIVKAGGVVDGYNNQRLFPAKAPDIPESIKESRIRDEYHKAIGKAKVSGSRTAYLQNFAGLALDLECGTAEERAAAVAPYIKDEITGKTAEIESVLDVVRIADDPNRRQKSIFKQYLDFLRELMKKSLNTKRYPIIVDEKNKDIQWSDIFEINPGEIIRLARNIQTAVHEAYEQSRLRARENKAADEASRRQASSQSLPPSHTTTRSEKSTPDERSNRFKIII